MANIDGDAGGPPVCYRHPDRESYVRCGRCGRYICPDDMVSASVGFQCHECVKAGNKGVRTARTVTGGVARSDSGVITTAIIAINVAVFLAVQGSDRLLERLLLTAYSGDGHGVAQGGWYRLITATFLHQQTFHIALNMIVLWMFGRPLEARLGRVRYIATYLICGLGGSCASYLFNPPGTASLGASGAVFGLIGVLLVVERRFGSNTPGVLVYLAILLLPGIVISNVDWRAHVGGLVVGFLLGGIYSYMPRPNRNIWQAGLCLALTAALLVSVGARTHRIKQQLAHRFGPDIQFELVIHTGDNPCGELQRCNSASG
ncbi:MAG TPA: rhomboid family intramembrane serine protease [Sporichthyaceae bacterium]|nr:rhomboid family intramembrane serine protease [Sporichthyaceae bacterium]